jgi:hypothetical protein
MRLAAQSIKFESGRVGDTSQNGNLCTFAESRCNVLNRLAGQRHRLRSVQECAFSTKILLITKGLGELTSP